MIISKQKCDELIFSAENKGGWIRMYKNKKHSYYMAHLELDETLTNDIKKYCISNLNLSINNVNAIIIKYIEGDFFTRHIDQNKDYELNKDFIYNINVRLNDEFEGGEFWLNDKPHQKPIGELYHYKSNEWHEVKKITKGQRYTVLFYIRYRDLESKEKNLI